MIARIVTLYFLVFLNEVLSSGDKDKEHVHFKIHVPELINHHIHTKTVFIHVHKTVPRKKKKTPKHEEHHENWSSWSSYDHHDEEKKYGGEDHKSHDYAWPKSPYENQEQDYKWPDTKSPYGYGIHGGRQEDEYKWPESRNPYDYANHATPDDGSSHYRHDQTHLNHAYPHFGYSDTTKSSPDGSHVGRTVGYASPPQFSVQELSGNDVDGPRDGYESGWRHGFRAETAGEYSDELSKFSEDRRVLDEAREDGHEDESHGRTNAGRYFVSEDDEEDYDEANGEDDRRRMSAKIFRVDTTS